MPCTARLGFTGTNTAMLALTLTLLGAFSAAHAQSSYALTKLSPPFLGKVGVTGHLDSQNRVTGTVGYLSGYNFLGFGIPSGPVYKWYVARWRASTAASVSPTKLISTPHTLDRQSPDGSKLLVSGSSQSYYDADKRQFMALPSGMPALQFWQPKAINNNGVIVGIGYGLSDSSGSSPTLNAVRWTPGAAALETLQTGSAFNRASAEVVNRHGLVAGRVGAAGTSDLLRAALWPESGAVEVLNGEPDTASAPIGLSDAGDALIQIDKPPGVIHGYAVVSGGVTKPILPPGPNDRLYASDIGASGVVVGTYALADAPAGTQDRAFIWKDGALHDLNEWVKARGVKVPTGALFTMAWRINAQGSILASLRDSDGRTTLVRLTARP